ncbi:MAG: DinB family protein [Pseudomonadota bacterium]
MTPDHARLMARYNLWQNAHILTAADTLSDAQRWEDRGAFFGSIARTLNHILWDDAVWLARIEGNAEEAERINARFPYADDPSDWGVYKTLRGEMDDRLTAWAENTTKDALDTRRPWFPGGRETLTQVRVMATQIFNHQTHHRGQVHAILTGFGVETAPTDVMMMWLEEA